MQDFRINAEVLAITAAAGGQDMGSRYEGVVHTKSDDAFIQTIEYVDIKRDYNSNVSDVTTVSFLMPLGDWVHGFFKERDNLEITLTAHTVGKVVKQRFKLLVMKMDPGIEQGHYDDVDIQTLNKKGMTNIIGQCLSKTIEGIRDTTVYGVFKDATVADVLNGQLTKAMNGIAMFDFSFKRNVDIISPNNSRKYEHILVPDTVHALDLPSFLHHGSYGVYNGGVGTYVQVVDDEEKLFVYPLYRKDMLRHTKKKLQITAVSAATTGSLDCTYGMDGDMLKILVSALNESTSKGEADLKNKGSGVTYTDTEALLTRPVKVSETKVETKKDNLKRTFVHKDTKDKSLKKEQYGVTTNGYNARSSVLKSDSKFIQVQWNFSNARLLIPAMGLTYMVEEKDGIVTYDGVLQAVHITTDNNSKMEVAVLFIAIELNSGSSTQTGGASGVTGIIDKVMSIF